MRLGIECMTVSKPLLSHQACMYAHEVRELVKPHVCETRFQRGSLHHMSCVEYQPLPQSSAE